MPTVDKCCQLLSRRPWGRPSCCWRELPRCVALCLFALVFALCCMSTWCPVGEPLLVCEIKPAPSSLADTSQTLTVNMEQKKTERASAKSIVTKQINAIRQKAAECEGDITSMINDLKTKFKTFTDLHNDYAGMVSQDKADECDEYFADVQSSYIDALEKYYPKVQPTTPQDNSFHDTSMSGASGFSPDEMLTMMNLPKVELKVFDGNPLHYHAFIKSFDANVDKVCSDPDLKLTRLLQYVSGSALEAVRCCLLIGGVSGYSQARNILEARFGNSYLVKEKIVKELRLGKPVRSPDDIQQFADDLKNGLLILQELDMVREVNVQSVIMEIASRLPTYAQIKWRKQALDDKLSKDKYPDFATLVSFVKKMALECNDPVYGSFPQRRDVTKHVFKSHSNPVSVAANATQSASGNASRGTAAAYARPEPPCVKCTQPHRLWNCPHFRSLTPPERLTVVVDNNLCHNCLRSSHKTEFCGKKSICAVDGCGQKHTMWIHCNTSDNVSGNASASDVSQGSTAESYSCSAKSMLMPVVEVTVSNGNQYRKCFALLDTGSSSSFCSNNLMQSLGVQGKPGQLHLSTLSSSIAVKSSVVDLTVSSESGEHINMDNVFVVDKIPVTSTSISVENFPHLQDIGWLPSYDQNDVAVDLLIGQDNADALLPIEIRRGKPGEPFAVRTMLGWCLNGKVPVERVTKGVISNFVSATTVNDDVSLLWQLENEGLDHISWSREDHAVIKFWYKETVKTGDGHYEIPIPWRDRNEPLPNNFIIAKSRLDSLVKRLRNDQTYDLYDAEIQKLLTKDYAEPVPDDDIFSASRIWYIPHHCVTTEKKPVRVVFDCAYKFKGKSLNDRCMQGPDLLNKLLPVLLRFRQHSIAIQGDIEAMHNQVRIPSCDRDALRFIWYVNDKLEYYRMTTHLFGGVWCASSSTYALRCTIGEARDTDPLVAKTIQKSFYVDDCLTSVTDVPTARTLIRETKCVLARGGFNLTKFAVNDLELLNEIPEQCRAKDVIEFGSECETKALGIKWRLASDDFFFELKRNVNGPVTRRRMLSFVSCIYDPLGLVGSLILGRKMIFQEATMRRLTWDETVPPDLENKWIKWTSSLSDIHKFSFPRCIKPHPFDDAAIELHHFSDASLKAYGCCSYIRCLNKHGEVHVQLVSSKNKLAPVKSCTIPRLELQARAGIRDREICVLDWFGNCFEIHCEWKSAISRVCGQQIKLHSWIFSTWPVASYPIKWQSSWLSYSTHGHWRLQWKFLVKGPAIFEYP